MSEKTKIQWTDVTDNIIIVDGGGWWCRMISPGCRNCYAAALNQNPFFGGNKMHYSGEPPKLRLLTSLIDSWAKQTKPKKHFVSSMTDVFGEWVTFEMALCFLRGMWRAPKQTFQILTKRPEVMAGHIGHWLIHDGLSEVPHNIWLGVSVEDQQRADERIPILLSIPARIRFLSVEPLLGPVDLSCALDPCADDCRREPVGQPPFSGHWHKGTCQSVDWIICGGESGKNARPCNVEWIRGIVQQCQAAGVPPCVKQLGARPYSEGIIRCDYRLQDPKGGDPSEWAEDLRVREMPRI